MLGLGLGLVLALVLADDAEDVGRLVGEMRWALYDVRAFFDIVVHETGWWEEWSSMPFTLEGEIATEAPVPPAPCPLPPAPCRRLRSWRCSASLRMSGTPT